MSTAFGMSRLCNGISNPVSEKRGRSSSDINNGCKKLSSSFASPIFFGSRIQKESVDSDYQLLPAACQRMYDS
jgi:hypothetical protein